MEAFNEKQNFISKWWYLLLPVAVVACLPFFTDDATRQDSVEMYIPLLVCAFVIMLFSVLNLHTRVDEKAVSVRFRPLQLRERRIAWDEIRSARVVKYNPLVEYGGWGIRKGWRKSKRAYNVSGNMGLELELANGDKLMIGTRLPEQLSGYLDYLKTKFGITAIQQA